MHSGKMFPDAHGPRGHCCRCFTSRDVVTNGVADSLMSLSGLSFMRQLLSLTSIPTLKNADFD